MKNEYSRAGQSGVHVLTTLDHVVRRLVECYEPDRTILFGSRARDGGHEDSDFDLVIIKETDARPIDRRAEVQRLLADRRVPLDLLVYTPAELWTLHALGSPFIEELMETGRVLYMRKATEAWLRECEEEHRMATLQHLALLTILTDGRDRGLQGEACAPRPPE